MTKQIQKDLSVLKCSRNIHVFHNLEKITFSMYNCLQRFTIVYLHNWTGSCGRVIKWESLEEKIMWKRTTPNLITLFSQTKNLKQDLTLRARSKTTANVATEMNADVISLFVIIVNN